MAPNIVQFQSTTDSSFLIRCFQIKYNSF